MFYRHRGKLKRLTLGWHPAMTLAEAREAWREARRRVVRKDAGHRRQVADVAVDHAEQRADGLLVCGD